MGPNNRISKLEKHCQALKEKDPILRKNSENKKILRDSLPSLSLETTINLSPFEHHNENCISCSGLKK